MSAYLDTIDDLLRDWGKSAREGSTRIGFKMGVLGRIKGSTVKSASITPEEFEAIDKAVSQLKKIDDLLHDVATLTYIQNRTRDDVARKINKSKGAVSQYRHAVIAYVAGALKIS